MLVLRSAPDIKGALVEAELIQFRQLLLPHRHILKLAAVRQHGQELRARRSKLSTYREQTTEDVTVGLLR